MCMTDLFVYFKLKVRFLDTQRALDNGRLVWYIQARVLGLVAKDYYFPRNEPRINNGSLVDSDFDSPVDVRASRNHHIVDMID